MTTRLDDLKDYINTFDPADPKQIHHAISLLGAVAVEAQGRRGWTAPVLAPIPARKCCTCPATDHDPGGLIIVEGKSYCSNCLPRGDIYCVGDHSGDRAVLKAKAVEMSGRWAKLKESLEQHA